MAEEDIARHWKTWKNKINISCNWNKNLAHCESFSMNVSVLKKTRINVSICCIYQLTWPKSFWIPDFLMIGDAIGEIHGDLR